jgi:uncharacterized protein YyaL (SSP411 family)
MNDHSSPAGRKPNHLVGQTSPYLLQHLYNPVDWYPWGEEAHARARREDRPVFLSIGYAACHWCHVMERESFENPEIAELLNRHFVPIKVDREERPDIDEIYMNAVQMMTGQGGWPLSVFLTPDLRPFVGGTYFPPEDRYGRTGFAALLRRIRQAWVDSRAEVDRSAARLTRGLERVAAATGGSSGGASVGRSERARAAAELAQRYDPHRGGFGPAPKFPPDGALGLLLREHARGGETPPLHMTETTLDGMARGGMYDHVGGGFARYSVDEQWLVPHFEKMLYNQALLVPNYVDGWLLTRKPLYRRVVEQTLDFVRREMTDPQGGFHSSLDADSEGVEGRYYVWTPGEVEDALGPEDGRFFSELYGVTPEGNFEGRSIPNLLAGSLAERAAASGSTEEQLARRIDPLRHELLEARGGRVRPGTDDKILTAWNGLMITAFCRAYQAFGRDVDLEAARQAADFVLANLLREDRLLVSYRAGHAQLGAYLDDYAFLARGLLDLYESGFDARHLAAAERLAETMLEHFEDPGRGGWFFTADDHETLLTRNHSLQDGALPAGAGVATEVLLRLAVHRRRDAFRDAADRTLAAYQPFVARMPSAFASLLLAAELAEHHPLEIALVGPPDEGATRELLAVVRGRFRVCPVVQLAAPHARDEHLALLTGKKLHDGRATAYVCRDYACDAPTTDPAELARQLGDS